MPTHVVLRKVLNKKLEMVDLSVAFLLTLDTTSYIGEWHTRWTCHLPLIKILLHINLFIETHENLHAQDTTEQFSWTAAGSKSC